MSSRLVRYPRALIPEALRHGIHVSSSSFSCIFPEKGSGYAIIIPKKISGKAVERNKIRRRTREILRGLSLPEALIIFPKKTVQEKPFAELSAELSSILSKLPISP